MQIAVLEAFSQVIRRKAYSMKKNLLRLFLRFINSHVSAVYIFTFHFSRICFFLLVSS